MLQPNKRYYYRFGKEVRKHSAGVVVVVVGCVCVLCMCHIEVFRTSKATTVS